MNTTFKNIFYSAIILGTFLIIRKPINKTINKTKTINIYKYK